VTAQGAGRNVLLGTRSATRAGDIVGVLDIGTSKTVCLIVAAPGARGGLWRREGACVLGFGHRPSRGLKAGAVMDLESAGQTLRDVVNQAEQSAGLTLNDALVAVTCGRPRSIAFEAETRIEDRVRAADTERLMQAGRNYAERAGHTLVHLNHVAYRLDGAGGVADPSGMAGAMLAADLHAVIVEDGPLRSLLQAVERAYLVPTGLVPAPYASGLAATTEEERQHGVTCVDMGAGATTISMFADGQLLWIGCVAIGGHHLTFDIARALSVTFAEAERIKTLYGTLAPAPAYAAETDAADAGPDSWEPPLANEVPDADLAGIIAGRMSDLFARVSESLERSGVASIAADRIVITGGAGQLPGLGAFAQEALGRRVRVGRPKPVEGMPSFCTSPQFSTAFGLVQIALAPPAAAVRSAGRADKEGASYLKRVGQWLRESF
jgi:cell division protein FtsA